jgi:LmbE family N-acetylglucosaminyl deacetylase
VVTVVISPHLDDAVLSLGGRIAAWADEGPVVVATVYSAGPPLDSVPADMRQFADYQTRCREDEAPAGVLGARTRWLGHVEHAFRGRRLSLPDVFTTPATRDGFSERAAITASLDALLDPAPARIAVPLGIGNHVDHVECMVAATDWLLAHDLVDRAVFYEDFYAVSTRMRRAHWLAARRRWRWWRAPLWRAPRLARMLGGIARARGGPPVEDLLARSWRGAAWQVEAVPLGDAAAARKQEAIACYTTQTRAFGGAAGIARVLAAYHRWWGGEPLWRCALPR